MTLVELVVSAAAAALLLGGMASAIVVAAQALPENTGALEALVDGGLVLEQLSGELALAVAVTEFDEHAVTFEVPDRDADGTPEQIRYSWDGTAGDPVERSYNGGTARAVVAAADDFSLAYARGKFEEPTGSFTEEEAPAALVAEHVVNQAADWRDIGKDEAIAQSFRPSLPSGVTSWRATAIQLYARLDNDKGGEVEAQLRVAESSGKPTDVVLASCKLRDEDLGWGGMWWRGDWSDCGAIDLQTPVCIVVRHKGGSDFLTVRYQTDDFTSLDVYSKSKDKKEEEWDIVDERKLGYRVEGVATVRGEPQTVEVQRLLSARVRLVTTLAPGSVLETAVTLLNEPIP
jgi:hypothetical protein